MLQLHLHHFRLNTWHNWIGQRQLQGETRNFWIWCTLYRKFDGMLSFFSRSAQVLWTASLVVLVSILPAHEWTANCLSISTWTCHRKLWPLNCAAHGSVLPLMVRCLINQLKRWIYFRKHKNKFIWFVKTEVALIVEIVLRWSQGPTYPVQF